MKDKLYVVIRTDLSWSQRAVQSVHAASEYLLHNNTTWDNGTLVILKVANENELKLLTKALEYDNIPFTSFREPDIGDQMTAVASLGGNKYFETMRLL